MRYSLLAFMTVASIVGVPAYAHHSFATYYLENQSMSIDGQVTEFAFRSPHAWVHVMAKDDKGQMRRFSAEWSNPNRLQQGGVTKDTLKPGDRLILTGSPGRNPGEHVLHLKRIERPADGWMWGGAPR